VGALRCLLDTCVFLWLCAEPRRLSARARKLLSSADAELILSDISVLEISLKWEARKISLPVPPRAWIAEQTAIWRTTDLPLTRAMIHRASELPGHHRDPFDRLLVAAALEAEATIITPDEAIQVYPVPWLW
jgi:PIN domain nuclease of toxin-antitoxin system